MRVSYKTDYALKTLLDLTLNADSGVVQVSEIARRQDIPAKFLEQILLMLKRAGFVASKRGQKGGYYLAMAPAKITLAAVVRLTEGYLSPITCVSKHCYSLCADEGVCPFREVWTEIRDYTTRKLEKLTIQDMCERAAEISGNKILNYVI